MSQEKCKRIEALIKNLSTTQMEELFKIFQRNKCSYTVNNNGIFLNLSWLSDEMLDQIELFITFCIESKEELDKYDIIYQHLNEQMNDKKREVHMKIENDEQKDTSTEIKRIVPRISSSMKYYLLKKKFSKNFISSNPLQMKECLHKEKPILEKSE